MNAIDEEYISGLPEWSWHEAIFIIQDWQDFVGASAPYSETIAVLEPKERNSDEHE